MSFRKNLVIIVFDLDNFKKDQKELEQTIILAHKRNELTEQDWWTINFHCDHLSEEFISKFRNKMNWTFITNSQRMYSEDFLIENFPWLSWSVILKHRNILTVKFIESVESRLNQQQWGDLIRMGLMDENLIRKYKYCVDWKTVCGSMKLSTGFMREHQNFLDWWMVSSHQMLPINFLREFKNKIQFHTLFRYNKFHLPKKLQKEFLGEVLYD